MLSLLLTRKTCPFLEIAGPRLVVTDRGAHVLHVLTLGGVGADGLQLRARAAIADINETFAAAVDLR